MEDGRKPWIHSAWTVTRTSAGSPHDAKAPMALSGERLARPATRSTQAVTSPSSSGRMELQKALITSERAGPWSKVTDERSAPTVTPRNSGSHRPRSSRCSAPSKAGPDCPGSACRATRTFIEAPWDRTVSGAMMPGSGRSPPDSLTTRRPTPSPESMTG